MDKYIRRALKSLNIKWNDNQDFELKTKKDIDGFIYRHKEKLSELEYAMIEAEEAKKQLEDELQLLYDLKHQTKVEEYKEMNPGREIF